MTQNIISPQKYHARPWHVSLFSFRNLFLSLPEPSAAPVFVRDKIRTSSTSLNLVWQPPPVDSLNGEILGYELTYRPVREATPRKVTISEDILRIQVRGHTSRGSVHYELLQHRRNELITIMQCKNVTCPIIETPRIVISAFEN